MENISSPSEKVKTFLLENQQTSDKPLDCSPTDCASRSKKDVISRSAYERLRRHCEILQMQYERTQAENEALRTANRALGEEIMQLATMTEEEFRCCVNDVKKLKARLRKLEDERYDSILYYTNCPPEV